MDAWLSARKTGGKFCSRASRAAIGFSGEGETWPQRAPRRQRFLWFSLRSQRPLRQFSRQLILKANGSTAQRYRGRDQQQ